MNYEDFWKGLQTICPDVDASRSKKLCDGMVNVFADHFMQGGLTPQEFLLAVSIAVVPTLDILNADREKSLGMLCELLHAVSESLPKSQDKKKE